jgi:predicted HAD superfamily Cof-like phosphohydrolase
MINEEEDMMMLEEFIKTFKGSLDPRLWIRLIKEEADELEEALNSKHREEVLKELADLMYVSVGLRVLIGDDLPTELMQKEEIEEVTNLFERVCTLLESMEEMFEEDAIDEACRRVHKSNMSKLGDDGKPIFREDGKVLKGPNYKKPDLSDLI